MTRGATGLPETTCRRDIRRAKQAMGEELTKRKPKKRKGRGEVWGERERRRGDGSGGPERSLIMAWDGSLT